MDSAPPAPQPPSTTPLDLVRVLRAGGGALFVQAQLHGQLAQVEWQEEKKRLLRMLAVSLLGFACLLCTLAFAGALAVALAWETAYRLPVLAALVLVYAAGTAVAWGTFRGLVALGEQAFAATREELSADAALLKRNL